MDTKRGIVASIALLFAVIVGVFAYQFIAALTVAVFLYYATRKFYIALDRFRMPKQLRAALTITLLGVPLVVLLGYTVLLIVIEARDFVQTYPVFEATPDSVAWFEGVGELPELTIDGLLAAYQSGQFDAFIEFTVAHAGLVGRLVSGLLLNLLIVLVVTYYLLLDGGKLRAWVLQFDDDTGSLESFVVAADHELEAVLFGNLLNVIVVAVLAIVVFMGYNAVAPAAVSVPYPALAGALTGLASLIPVVGMKVVYVPLAILAAVPSLLANDLTQLVYLAGFLVSVLIVVDTIPDLVLRPYLSGKRTHVGLLMLAYIIGPVALGFHGLFLAPIVLVLGIVFADTVLPEALGAETPPDTSSQKTLEEF